MRGGRDDLQRVMDETRKGMARKARRPLDLEHPQPRGALPKDGVSPPEGEDNQAQRIRAEPHGLCGRSPATTVPGGHTGFVDDQPGRGSPTRRSCLTGWSPRAARAGWPRPRRASHANYEIGRASCRERV